ncbi:hypothetical protein FIV42_09150 [Persicimonas caeni]|uniref:Sacsin/Nov domain-containing protein n=1 Tax=Persicimonas caeni TaxID=2292766 RepID=A0A4Y6PRD1_PERCE|nr:ATP-binding protein [Persicimonas caeni]QDG50892.1 hypothetical protein FIV42_09150 [Persicimonas caeni]QED32113.1 hypothetical protein FRD00_09145 [Persicimonas caeni]
MTEKLQKQTILDDLVNQFADPLSFFRELIQNAIDAGSGEVNVHFGFDPHSKPDATLPPGEGASRALQREADGGRQQAGSLKGTMTIHVDDFGEGMNREIIETKLTRLFSSAKDDDYTKIGKFGIGFVSVFAIEPEAVCVDTGRTGESWRVLFSADKTYELYKLDHPIEGTQIRLFKEVGREEFDDFVARARDVIMHWCKHVPIPIYFEDEELAAPFDIDSPCKLEHREEGTRLVMGFVDSFEAPFGYYNRGLTLKEGDESPWPHIAFKLDSRYLEHTLTRDQILEDKNFHKAWKLLEEIATERLPEKLVDLIEAEAKHPAGRDLHEELCGHLLRWLEVDGALRRDWSKRPLIPTVHGEAVSLRECERRANKGQLFAEPEATALTARLADDYLVIRAADDSPIQRLIDRTVGHRPPVASRQFAFAAQAAGAPAAGIGELGEQLALLVREMGGALDWVGLLEFDDGVAGNDRMALALEDRHEPVPIDDVPACGEASLCEAHHLVLNLSDERVDKLVRLSKKEPEWAAYTLLKLLLLDDELRPELDSLLAARAVERRKRRLD